MTEYLIIGAIAVIGWAIYGAGKRRRSRNALISARHWA